MTTARSLPEQAVLRELLSYDPETGILRWRERARHWFACNRSWRRWNNKHAGEVAISSLNGGYLTGRLLGQSCRAQRVAWKWMTGDEPEVIDHQNGNRADNRWANLRGTDSLGNRLNARKYVTNKTGQMGVNQRARDGRWVATIKYARRPIFLGAFDAFSDAVDARKAAERELGFHPNHGRAA